MASRSRPTPSEWAAKRQAAIELAKVRRESERLGEITSQHTFRPTLRSSTVLQSGDAEAHWQSSSAEWVAKRRATLKVAADKKEAEREKEAQSVSRRSASAQSRNLRSSQSPGRSPRCLKGSRVKVVERCASPVIIVPQRSRTSFYNTEPLAPLCGTTCIAQKSMALLIPDEVVATASPLRLAAHERVRRAKSPMNSPRPQDVEDASVSKFVDAAILAAIGQDLSVPAHGPHAATEDAEPSHTIGSEAPHTTKHVALEDAASSNTSAPPPDIEGSAALRSSLGLVDVHGTESLMSKPCAKVVDLAASHLALPPSMPPSSDSVLSPRSSGEGRRISWSAIAVHTDDACI